jgi:hypothetical protein
VIVETEYGFQMDGEPIELSYFKGDTVAAIESTNAYVLIVRDEAEMVLKADRIIIAKDLGKTKDPGRLPRAMNARPMVGASELESRLKMLSGELGPRRTSEMGHIIPIPDLGASGKIAIADEEGRWMGVFDSTEDAKEWITESGV